MPEFGTRKEEQNRGELFVITVKPLPGESEGYKKAVAGNVLVANTFVRSALRGPEFLKDGKLLQAAEELAKNIPMEKATKVVENTALGRVGAVTIYHAPATE